MVIWLMMMLVRVVSVIRRVVDEGTTAQDRERSGRGVIRKDSALSPATKCTHLSIVCNPRNSSRMRIFPSCQNAECINFFPFAPNFFSFSNLTSVDLPRIASLEKNAMILKVKIILIEKDGGDVTGDYHQFMILILLSKMNLLSLSW